jgi:hypothetical protein
VEIPRLLTVTELGRYAQATVIGFDRAMNTMLRFQDSDRPSFEKRSLKLKHHAGGFRLGNTNQHRTLCDLYSIFPLYAKLSTAPLPITSRAA